MAADSTVLREYLIALGFKVDERGEKKADESVTKLDAKVARLGKVALGTATAFVAMVTTIASQMERLYFSSQRADSTVRGLQNLSYGFASIGLNGDSAAAAVEKMASSLRSNPGFVGLLNQLGVSVKGRTVDKVFMDFLDQIERLPYVQQVAYANLFGISEGDLYLLQRNKAELKETIALRESMTQQAGINPEQQAAEAHELMSAFRQTWEYSKMLMVTLATDRWSEPMIGALKQVNELLKEMVALVNDPLDRLEKYRDFFIWLTNLQWVRNGLPERKDHPFAPEVAPGTSIWWEAIKQDWKKFTDKFKVDKEADSAAQAVDGDPEAAQHVVRSGPIKREVEKQYALPPGSLDRTAPDGKVPLNWGTGPNANTDPAGAQGYMADLLKAELDKAKSRLALAETDADSSRAVQDILEIVAEGRRRGLTLSPGDLGGFTSPGAGAESPKADLGFTPTASTGSTNNNYGAPTINQNIEYNVHGVSDPTAAAREVGRQQQVNNADLVRNLTPRVK